MFADERLEASWIRLGFKIISCFRYVQHKIMCQSLLGENTFMKLMHNDDIRRMALAPTAPAPT